MANENIETIEGPGLPLVASYYVQGRYRRASVVEQRGQPLTFLHAAAEWRQKAMLRQAMIDDLIKERDELAARLATPAAPGGEASHSDTNQPSEGQWMLARKYTPQKEGLYRCNWHAHKGETSLMWSKGQWIGPAWDGSMRAPVTFGLGDAGAADEWFVAARLPGDGDKGESPAHQDTKGTES